MTMYDARTRLSAHVVEEVRRYMAERHLLNTIVPRVDSTRRSAQLRPGHIRI